MIKPWVELQPLPALLLLLLLVRQCVVLMRRACWLQWMPLTRLTTAAATLLHLAWPMCLFC